MTILERASGEGESSPRVCVIGAGLAGLTASYDLGRRGNRVLLLDAASDAGGLASSICVDGEPLERFYHFVCRPDRDLVRLLDELGVSRRLHWRSPRTSLFHGGRLHRFSGAYDLLRFPLVPVAQRLRLGLTTVRTRFERDWRRLDQISAADWLRREAGTAAYEVIWRPLLEVKFGRHHDRISAAWLWHRIHRVARSRTLLFGREQLGYLERGSSTVIEALLERLSRMPNVEIRTGARVERICATEGRVSGVLVRGNVEPFGCAAVVSTLPLPVLERLAPDLDPDFRSRLRAVDYFGVICTMAKLRRPLTDNFWVNVNDPAIPFNGVIEYTNLNSHRARLGHVIVYVPIYLPTEDARFRQDDSSFGSEVVATMRVINPEFDESWLEELHVFRESHAQPICTVGFSARVPEHRAPMPGLYLTDSVQFFPEDRTLNAAIRLGRKVARLISEDFSEVDPVRGSKRP